MRSAAGNEGVTESLLIVTGTMGAGKTSVMAEASDILSERNIVHASIDLDALAVAHLGSVAGNDEIMYLNLQSVYRNCADRGVQRFLLARAVEDRARLDLICSIVPAANTAVCRLTASIDVMKQRVAMRDPGMLQRELMARVAELNTILDRAALEDFTVINENRSVTAVALEMLVEAGWISD
jgi:tRNA uridine 5-carbamoylmethylation protein Kti12